MAEKLAQAEKSGGLFVDIERARVKEPVRNLDAVKILFETLHNPLLGIPAYRIAAREKG
jgi:hypothetical protein